MLVLIAPNSISGFFDKDVQETLSITASFDVAGKAIVKPFLNMPDGSSIAATEASTTDVSGYTFNGSRVGVDGSSPTFVIREPSAGTYHLVAIVTGLQDGTLVSFNTQFTRAKNSKAVYLDRPTIAAVQSIQLNKGETAQLVVPIVYPLFRSQPPHHDDKEIL